ncbi:hypothetical protein [Photobacterium atrarenae]|uniref:Uncharacterized protein n=1 Tax=Photobacterium atrarenae TaxID=865757 RepID=A0ABY5GF29_9GAMM|nr:hypothetical protein [Photobacterium atrarenae]UTV27860.1 hypothetical protein NNL38_00605 [Photobacterium atrarenae]
MTIGIVAKTTGYTPVILKASPAMRGAQTAAPSGESARRTGNGDDTVSLSSEAKRRQGAEARLEEANNKNTEAGDIAQTTKKAESFAYGALGLDHPDSVKQHDDEYYSAGQGLSALGTVATVLLAVI